MSKYDPLTEFLQRQPGDRIAVPFDDIEDADRIGVELPVTARERRQWWANETAEDSRHVQSRAWLSAGWQVDEVDLPRELVTFVRR